MTEHLSSPQVLSLVFTTLLSPAASLRPNARSKVPNESSASSPHAVPRPATTSTSSPPYPTPLQNSAPARNRVVRIVMCLDCSLLDRRPRMLRPSPMACTMTHLEWQVCWGIRARLPSTTSLLLAEALRDGPVMNRLTQSCSSTGRLSTSLTGTTFLSQSSYIPFACLEISLCKEKLCLSFPFHQWLGLL